MFSLGSIAGIHDKIAKSAHKEGMKIQCKLCNKQNLITKEQFAKYLADGWPECCNHIMELKS